jgi:hypothetical protein
MTKIIFGINVPYLSQKIDREATDEKCRNAPRDGRGVLPVFVPCIRIHKELSFELCDICGSQVVAGRAKRGLTTCSPAHNSLKWDAFNGLVIEKERNACGVRPKSFWQTIKHDCFKRDNFTCTSCNKTRKELSEEKNCNYEDKILHCHHIIPIKDGGNNKLENLQTLCGRCHKKEHSRHKNIEKKHKSLGLYLYSPDS